MATVQFCNVRGVPQGEAIVLDRRRRRLSTIAKQHGNPSRPFLVSVHRGVQPGEAVVVTDDTVRKRASWKDTLIGGDDVVLVTYLPLGSSMGGGQKVGKQIGMAVGMLALAIAMPWAVGSLGVAGSSIGALSFGGKLIAAGLTAGIAIGAGFLISQTFNTKRRAA